MIIKILVLKSCTLTRLLDYYDDFEQRWKRVGSSFQNIRFLWYRDFFNINDDTVNVPLDLIKKQDSPVEQKRHTISISFIFFFRLRKIYSRMNLPIFYKKSIFQEPDTKL